MEPKQLYHTLRFASIGVCLALMFTLFPGYAPAQEAITVTDKAWEAEFRDHLTFTLNAESTAEIVEADLFYQIAGQIATSRNEAEFTPGRSIEAVFEIDQIDPSNYFPPGTELQYWWKIVDAAGNELITDKETFIYLDNRYEWKTLENDRLTLYWYEGDETFGQALFERANLALDTLETDVGVTIENPIKIFIYGSHEDLLGALRTSAQEWTGGVAFTEFGVVVIGIHPRQLEWGLNAMTHEMTHLIIHQATDNPFGDLPRWLDEGIAVYNENRDELDDDFRLIFEQAVENEALMTLRTLSSPFPSDPMQANLAYGQSGAVVRYIIDTYGSEAMAELLAIFAEGALYDEALEQALGVDTTGLDNEFRATLDLPPLPGTEEVAEPEIEEALDTELSAEIEIEEADSGESGAASEEAAELVEEALESAEEIPEPALAATPGEAAAGEEAAQPAGQPEVDPESEAEAGGSDGGSSAALPCLTGLVFLGALGVVFTARRQGPRFE